MRMRLFSLAPRLLVVGLVAALAIGVLAVSAQSGELDLATAPSGGWSTLAVGERAWYAFNYPGDGSEIRIRMSVSPRDSARFSVWSAADAAAWVGGGAETPIGRGSVNNAMGGDLNWVGRITIQGRYYVCVEQVGGSVAGYQIEIEGNSVTFPGVSPATATVAPTRTPTVTATPGPTETVGPSNSFSYAKGEVVQPTGTAEPTGTGEAAAATAGPATTPKATASSTGAAGDPVTTATTQHKPTDVATGDTVGDSVQGATDATPVATVALSAGVVAPPALPDAGTTPANALSIDGIPASLAEGGRRWYAFASNGDSRQILITMSVSPRDSATFSVWSAGEAAAFAAGRDVSPVGRGSVNTALGGDLTWAGQFSIRGTYYVLVEQHGEAASFYTLEIGGPGAN